MIDKNQLADLLKIDQKKAKKDQIEAEMQNPDFWLNQEKAAKLSQELSYLGDFIAKFDQASSQEDLSELEKEALFSGEYDHLGAYLMIHAGAGGTEAQDWAEMLLRMFMRFAERKGFKAELIGSSPGEEAGIKSAELKIDGVNAYGMLKSEAGVHRLVRISPYDADKARHTSFALVEVIPQFDEVGDVEIDDKDLKIDVYRSGGHGGQSVNTTDSAVRITHLPTKTVVTCQNERSQLQNRESAMKVLKSKIKVIQLEEKKAKEKDIMGGHVSAEWGNQIRSYVLQPYQQVKDHRTDYVSSNPTEVLDGDLDGFIETYLKKLKN